MIEHLFDLVNPDPADAATGRPSNIDPPATKHNRPVRRLHGDMKRDTATLVAATLRTGLLVGIALILILVLLPAAVAQAAGPR